MPVEKRIACDPRSLSSYVNGAACYMQMKTFPRAGELLRKALELKPDFHAGFNNRGVAFIMLERYGDAEKDLTIAYELDPDDGNTMVRLAELYSAKNDVVEACKWLKQGVKKGYRDWKYLKTAPTFDNLRKWPCYEWALSGK